MNTVLKKFLSQLLGSKKPAAAAKKKPAAAKKTVSKKKAPAKKPTAKKKPVKKPAKRSVKKKAAAEGAQEIGRVVAFFRIPVVAVIRATKQPLKSGDRIWIKGHTTNIKMTASSLQVDHKPVSEVKKGKEAGLKLPSRARLGDRVYRI